MTPFTTSFEPVLEAYLRRQYDQGATAPIIPADENGVFPGPSLYGLLGGKNLIVVPDTCVIGRDIARACRTGRTTLISAANSRALRLYCPEHVIDEVFRRGEEFAERGEVSADSYFDRFYAEYLPLLRVVPNDGVPLSVLSPDEYGRVAPVIARGSKDVPSVILALALGAFYLTEDKAAWRAVYGHYVNADERFRWLEALMASGQVDELGQLFVATVVLPSVVIGNLVTDGFAVLKRHPVILAFLAGAAVGGALCIPREAYPKIGSAMWNVLSFAIELYRPYHDAMTRIERTAPEIPSWFELRRTNDRRAVLLRACLYEAARHNECALAAPDLSKALPDIGVGKRAQLVREAIRSNACFSNPFIGRWQLGYPLSA
jgi:predicted nucleic acid-binding protein